MIWLLASSVGVWLTHYRYVLFFSRLRLIFIPTVVFKIVRLCFPIWNWDAVSLGHRTKFFLVFLFQWTNALLFRSPAIIATFLFRTWRWTWWKCRHRLLNLLLDLACLVFQQSLLFLCFDRSPDFLDYAEQELAFSLFINVFALNGCCLLEKQR